MMIMKNDLDLFICTHGDFDLVYYEDKPCLERFTRPMDYKKCFQYNYPENDHIKIMVKCKQNKLINFKGTGHPHGCVGAKYPVYADGTQNKTPKSWANHNQIYNLAYLKHFYMKTIDEYVRFKLKRGHPDVKRTIFNKRHDINKFFKINKHTPEKDKYIKNLKNEN